MSEMAHPFSRPVSVDEIRGKERELSIEATPAELEALADFLGIKAVNDLRADIHIRPAADKSFRVSGNLTAEVIQTCVVTLEPVKNMLKSSFERMYAIDADDGGDENIEYDEDDADPPEVVKDGVVDVGELLTEQIALDMDPFPRAEGAAFSGYSSQTGSADGEDVPPHPFAGLSRLKSKMADKK